MLFFKEIGQHSQALPGSTLDNIIELIPREMVQQLEPLTSCAPWTVQIKGGETPRSNTIAFYSQRAQERLASSDLIIVAWSPLFAVTNNESFGVARFAGFPWGLLGVLRITRSTRCRVLRISMQHLHRRAATGLRANWSDVGRPLARWIVGASHRLLLKNPFVGV